MMMRLSLAIGLNNCKELFLLSFVGKLGDNPLELLEGDGLVGGGLLADMGAVQHLEQFVVVDAVLDPPGHGLELLVLDDSILIGVVKGKDSLESFLGLEVSDLTAHDLKELLEVDGFVLVSEGMDEREDEGVPLVKAEFLQSLVDFGGVDGAAVVLIENEEGVSEFVVVLFAEAVFPAGCLGGGGGRGGLHLGSAHWIALK
jgi:hypothetical protein